MKLMRWLLLDLILLALAACGPGPSPTAPRPTGEHPIRWLICEECAAQGRGIPLWDSPQRQQVVARMAHLTFVFVLDQQTGPDGETYYRVWAANREGWVEAAIVAEEPPTGQRPLGLKETPMAQVTPSKGTPHIVLTELSYDFGDISPDAAVEHVFKLRNAGSADLVIERVSSS